MTISYDRESFGAQVWLGGYFRGKLMFRRLKVELWMGCEGLILAMYQSFLFLIFIVFPMEASDFLFHIHLKQEARKVSLLDSFMK